MTREMPTSCYRILVVDDNPSIHDDFRRILASEKVDNLADLEAALFGSAPCKKTASTHEFEIASAFQGQEGLALVKDSIRQDRPFAAAFIDMRMPPGWDGIETIKRLWQVDPRLEIVICTAYSDYSWQEVVSELGHSDRFLVLKKPFEAVEVRQLALGLARKHELVLAQERKLQELEDAVHNRTRQLNHALEEAQTANKTKTEFLANVSHEIRTPMTAILGFADILLDEINPAEVSPRASEAVEIIQRNGEHLLELISDILDLCKVEAGMMITESISCSPIKVLSEVVSLMQVKAYAKDLKLSIHEESSIPKCICTDPKRLKQILVNLIGNAIKFTDQGSVEVRLRYCDNDTPQVEFDVIDTGIGIHPEHKQKLFQPFSQADTSVTRRYGGTGLGLSISRRLARLLGGEVQLVDTRPGNGSRFRLTIAAFPGTEETTADCPPESYCEAALDPQPYPKCDESPTSLQGVRILLAEDGQDNQTLITRLLKKVGAEVTLAENGQYAVDKARLAMVRGEPYNVILMDMQMPIMDGYDATNTLRAEGYSWPIIALTAHAMNGDRQKCLDAGCTDYATKPIQKDSLISMLVRYSTPTPIFAAQSI